MLNGHPEQRLPNTLHLSFPGVSGRTLLARASEVAASLGSAGHEEGDVMSGVLAAMRVSQKRARGAVRLSAGEPTTLDEIARAADALAATWTALAGEPSP